MIQRGGETGATLLDVREHSPQAFAGSVEMLDVQSEILRDNALGDPCLRELVVYSPPGDFDAQSELPLLLVLPGFSGNGRGWFDTHSWWPGWVQTYDRAVLSGERPPVRLAVPDCMTRLGGSQYVDSPAVGDYASYVAGEIVPLLLARHPGAQGRLGVMGKSSGGFGALRLAMHNPGLFQACASISGDCAFDQHYPHEFLNCLRGLVAHGGDPAKFLEAFAEKPQLGGDGHAVIYVLACAACYSPGKPGADGLPFKLPFDLRTGELIDDVWQRWMDFDPLRLVKTYANSLQALKLLWIECGLADEFHLQWGARRLSTLLSKQEIAHTHVEHPGGHRGIDGRYGEVVAALAAAL
ncbi:MAG: hypothetical protein ACI8QS_000182 [Planctomycetota bacterium]